MDKDIYVILSRYLTGQSSKEENVLLEDWLSKSEENKAYFEEIRFLWSGSRLSDRFSNKEAVFDKVLNNIQVEEHELPKSSKPAYFLYKKTALVAASLLILMSFAISFFLIKINQQPDPEPVAQVIWIEKNNPAGQKSKIYLPDGTVAFLNSESSIRYISDFTDSARDIYMEGEAFFDVKKDPTRPFRVHCDDVSVIALGTQFNVNSFREEKSVISLVEGKVSVKSKEHVEILKPGESLLIHEDTDKVIRLENNQEPLIAWKDGVLIFEGDNLRDAIKKLERWYGVHITVSGTPDKNMKYSGIFKNEYLSNVLESMRYGRDFYFTVDGKNVNINFY